MNTLAVHNPATGELIAELPADDAASVAAKYAAARAAQPAWAAVPLAERKACIDALSRRRRADLDALAAVMTRETGKPIKMSRNELNGLLAAHRLLPGRMAAGATPRRPCSTKAA
jgi:acyl-CoA reductase-like NAD-dependent aldehyde dehydrogenase